MLCPEKELIAILKEQRVDFTASLPCEKIKVLLEMLPASFYHLPLTREEEGAGICAGAALSDKRPAMFLQSSGVGNMLNALLSLNQFYELPLALFISQRGVYKEKIAAQLPMGLRLPAILKGAGIGYSVISSVSDFCIITAKLRSVYRRNTIHAFMLSPAIWEGSDCRESSENCKTQGPRCTGQGYNEKRIAPRHTRYGIIKMAVPFLRDKVVVCNLGIPSKELYSLLDQPSNFYMLGSMGMATPVGLGISLTSKKEVVVIDGDGSLLMNPGTLATVAASAAGNLTILAIDNAAYGSTGSQKTLTGRCVDLLAVARGFGIHNSSRAATQSQLKKALSQRSTGPRFIHIPAISGNSDSPNIPLDQLEIKRLVQNYLGAATS